jgi:drug/metabolite transporter (DMT)-like permease
MHKPVWWLGIGSMVVGAALGGLALQLGSVALVEPLLSTNLLFALFFASLAARQRVRPLEVVGALLLSAALGLFIAIGEPRNSVSPKAGLPTILLAVLVAAAVVAALISLAKRRTLTGESALIAAAAGTLFGLQDASTSATLADFDDGGVGAVLTGPWPYVLLAAAITGIMLSQSAFRAARLDYSLPPLVAAEPVVGVALGVTLLSDRISVSVGDLAAEACCLVAMVAGVILIARSASLGHPFAHRASVPESTDISNS